MPRRKSQQRSPDVFLCHSSRDKAFVRKLARNLHELGVYAWFDEWELPLGSSLHECIGRALETSSFVGVILTPDSAKSKWCKKELHQALSREDREGRSIVLPIIARPVAVPPFLEDKVWLDLTSDYLTGLAKLAGHVHALNGMKLTRPLDTGQLESLDDVVRLLEAAGWNNTQKLGAMDWDHLRELLGGHGIDIPEDDRISIHSDKTRRQWHAS